MPSRADPRWLLLLCLSLLFSPSHSQTQNPPCNPSDQSLLLAFSNSLNSPISAWSLNTSCCAWRGVRCLAGRVTALDLKNHNLSGPINASLAGLSQLASLDLSANHLKGPLPHQILRLPLLASLDLSLNQLSGPIPSNLSLPAITSLNISSNSFNGTHPLLPGSAQLSSIDISWNSFAGPIAAAAICLSSPRIHVLRFSANHFSGSFPLGFANCSSIQELKLDTNAITGRFPDELFSLPSLSQLYLNDNHLVGRVSVAGLTNLTELAQLDISFNGFDGSIPDVFARLKRLESFAAQSNLFTGQLPASFSNASVLKVLNLRNNSLGGEIDLDFAGMRQLSSLDLGSNQLTGFIPHKLPLCAELKTLNLARNELTGAIPDSFKNFSSLLLLSLSINKLSNISSALTILQQCPNLTSLVLTRNFNGEVMPADEIIGFPRMEVLVVANCGLSGSIPTWLANSTSLKVLDLSWNQLGGIIPPWIGSLDSLFYLDLSNNSLSGVIPESLTRMKGLTSRNSTRQQASLQEFFPFFIRRNAPGKGLQYNQVSSFPPSLILSDNSLNGTISPGFGGLVALHLFDLSKNRLSGTIPAELSSMSSLENLDLSYNDLTGSIPSSLSKLNFLSNFNVAYNDLSGPVPTGGQFLTFSNSDYEGNPKLCGLHLSSCEAPIQSVARGKNRALIAGIAIGIGLGTALLLAVVYFLVSRKNSRKQKNAAKELADVNGNAESTASRLVFLFQNMENEGLSIGDILESTDNFDQANIVGCGGFGLVYKATLPNGRRVAIKRLSGDYCQMEREFQAEVEALSRVQHRNLVLLHGYCTVGKDRLLIYSYMENGSLDYWLHEKFDGGASLDWSTRLRIAQGAARGLAFLHQSCQPHILHRDIKSSNILLDDNFEAHLADFGLARLILPYDSHVTTDLVGTLGYIPPEYSQSPVATFKGDVYSFGVVLLELLTGRRPVDMCKPKDRRDLISWVLQMRQEEREVEVFDPLIYDEEHERQMRQVLGIACLCSSHSPKLRPSTQQLVGWLDSIGNDNM